MAAQGKQEAASRNERRARVLGIGIAIAFLVLWIGQMILYLAQPDRSLVAVDYDLYMDATRRWLSGGPFYEAYQLAGPYEITPGDILYPPIVLPLLVVFTQLPALLWWLIPLAIVAAMVVHHRPNAVALGAMAICLWFPATSVKLIAGNPVMWAVVAVALGTRWAAAAPWALIKPSLFPFAAIGIRHRGWWLSLAVMGALTVVMLALTLDWLTAVRNGAGSGGLLYSLQEAPMMALPVLAWLGSTRSDAHNRRPWRFPKSRGAASNRTSA